MLATNLKRSLKKVKFVLNKVKRVLSSIPLVTYSYIGFVIKQGPSYAGTF
jgi:hypothetical protein